MVFSTVYLMSLSQSFLRQLPCENTDSLISKKSVAEKVGCVIKALLPTCSVLSIWITVKIYIHCRNLDGRGEGRDVSYKWFLI